MTPGAFKLRYLLKKHKITYGLLAEEMSFSRGHITRIMNETCQPSERFWKLFEVVINKHGEEDKEEILCLFLDVMNKWKETTTKR